MLFRIRPALCSDQGLKTELFRKLRSPDLQTKRKTASARCRQKRAGTYPTKSMIMATEIRLKIRKKGKRQSITAKDRQKPVCSQSAEKRQTQNPKYTGRPVPSTYKSAKSTLLCYIYFFCGSFHLIRLSFLLSFRLSFRLSFLLSFFLSFLLSFRP